MKLKLLIFDSNDEVVRQLQAAFNGTPELSARRLETAEIPKLRELDALYLSLPAAERWNPRLLFYESQVLKTDANNKGLPPYVVTGIAMKPADPRAGDSASELELVIKAVLDAVESYNQESQNSIKAVGFWTKDLAIDRIDVSSAGKIIRSAYEEHYAGRNG